MSPDSFDGPLTKRGNDRSDGDDLEDVSGLSFHASPTWPKKQANLENREIIRIEVSDSIRPHIKTKGLFRILFTVEPARRAG